MSFAKIAAATGAKIAGRPSDAVVDLFTTPVVESEPFPNHYDPVIFPGEHFVDGQHRVLISNASGRQLHKTSDFVTFTAVDTDWLSGEPLGGNNTFQDAVWRGDGTCVLLQNGGTETTTDIWTGSAADIDAATITRQGQAIANGGDCGAFYEASTGLIHIYTEDPGSPFGSVSSTKLKHYTVPENDLLNDTLVGEAFDTGGWGTGDPDVIEYGGTYYMFIDYTTSHPDYRIALLSSPNLNAWTLEETNFTDSKGGDFDVYETSPGSFVALSEYSGADELGVAVWRFEVNVGYSASVIGDSPVAYWRLGESAGTTATDEQGNHDGTYQNTPTLGAGGLIAGDDDTSVDLNGTDEWVDVSGMEANFNSQDEGTFEAWIHMDAMNSSEAWAIVEVGATDGTNDGIFLRINANGDLRMQYRVGGTNYVASHPITASTTYHVVGVFDASNVYLYVDGVLEATTARGANNTDLVQAAIGGKGQDSLFGLGGEFHFDGRIDEVAVYTSALSASRIEAHYNAGS